MIARLAALAIVDVVLIAAASYRPAAGFCLMGHVLIAIASLRAWPRDGRTFGMAPAIAGMAGPIGLLAAVPLLRLFPRLGRCNIEDDESATDALPQMSSLSGTRMLDGRVHHSAPENVGSLVTILHHGRVADRRRALETAVRAFRPALTPLVAIALNDGDQTIRALAAAASARSAQNLGNARARLERRIARHGDPAAALSLAALLADHARDNVLLSESQRVQLRSDALALFAEREAPELPSLAELRDTVRLETLWSLGDYDAIDRLAASSGTARSLWCAGATG